MQYLGTQETLVRQSYDWSETPPSIAVFEALAAVENVHPTDLHAEVGIVLYDNVDLEALDALVNHESDVSVSFTVENYHIRIDGTLLTVSSNAGIE